MVPACKININSKKNSSNQKLNVSYPDRRNNRKQLLRITHSTLNMNRCAPYQLQQKILTALSCKPVFTFKLSVLLVGSSFPVVAHRAKSEAHSAKPQALSLAAY
ncbi:MAG: hypothetical protein PVF38_13830 [Desulfobacterales bacterium]|jgi:hypothetical protein